MVFLILWYIYKIWKLKLKFQKHLSWWIFIHLVTIKFKTAHSIPTWGFLACIRMFEANRLQKGAFFFPALLTCELTVDETDRLTQMNQNSC